MFFRSVDTRTLASPFRKKRFQEFLEVLEVGADDSILDVGGLATTWEGTGLEQNVTILNLGLSENCPKPFRWIEADACAMDMIDDQCFDIVFSNSVIEHVGGLTRQRKLAKEIRRVGKKYWVQTPYKHFPLEVHFLFPFYQYLPHDFRIAVAKAWPFSYSKQLDLDPVYEAEHIWLLDRRRFRTLFPDAQILSEKFMGLTKSLIAVKTCAL